MLVKMKQSINYIFLLASLLVFVLNCKPKKQYFIQTTKGLQAVDTNEVWLSHEHILVDFIGADKIYPKRWDMDTVIKAMLPFMNKLSEYNVSYFVDATPNFIGRDVRLLDTMGILSNKKIMTNTGFYGARNSKFIPSFAKNMQVKDLAAIWIDEFENGIDNTDIKPGFIKIGVDNADPLEPQHQKLVEAAALTHLKTGLTIASHTGEAKGIWSQIKILKKMGVSPKAYIWVHAQNEIDNSQYLKAAATGCWISLDGLGWEIDKHVEKLIFAKENNILQRILISHDAGWYQPSQWPQTFKPYTNIFEDLIPKLKANGFTERDIDLLLKVNPVKAFAIEIKPLNVQ